MSLVKWFRKNNTKVMAIVVIVLMFGFIGGSYWQQLSQRRRAGQDKVVAHFGDNKEITYRDLTLARRELEILKTLRADVLLRNIGLLVIDAPDLLSFLLGELLFSEQRISPMLIRRVRQTIRANSYSVSDKQINDIYRRPMGGEIYWLLLKNEAQQAGVRVLEQNAGRELAGMIPQLFAGTTYSQLIGSIVKQQGIPEEEILAAYSKLLAVLGYSRMICSTEDITTAQMMQMASWENEMIDVNFVKIDSVVFAETVDEPTGQEISAHFDKYKKFFAGSVSEENPYGFGYKLLDAVKLEYIAVKLDDVSEIVTAPSQEEVEEYYQKHTEQFTEQVPSDPNDPNSPPIERTKTYAEVADIISKSLLQNKISVKAERIIQEARTLTEAGSEDTDIEPVSSLPSTPEGVQEPNLSTEQFRQKAADYKAVAEQLSQKHKIKVYTGQTGLLSAVDMQADRNLGLLYLKGYGNNPVGLTQVVFAVEKVGVSELGPFDVPKPRLYENIGPASDMLGQITVLVRVIEAKRASGPESIEQIFSKGTLQFEEAPEQPSQEVYSIKEKVTEDLKKLAAMDTVKIKAEEFVKLAAKSGWEKAINKFNKLYGQQAKQDRADVFELKSLKGLQRISSMVLRTLAAQSAGNPAAQLAISAGKKGRLFTEQLYSLVPQEVATLDGEPLIWEFKPDLSCYCIKDISIRRLEQGQYERLKTMRIYREEFVRSQSLAAVHLNPEKILKRMNFRLAKQEVSTDANVPASSEGTL